MERRIFLFGQQEQIKAMQIMLQKSGDLSVVGETSDETQVLDGLSKTKAALLLLYADGSASSYRVAQQVYMLRPNSIIFAIAPKHVMETDVENILQSGIRYIYEDKTPETELYSLIRNAMTIEDNRKQALDNSAALTFNSKVLVFYSPKDGVGKSTFLMSFAVQLTKMKKKVAVLDFDLQFGDINVLTNIETKETLAELLQEQSNPTIDVVRQYVTIHNSGVHILCAPRNAEYAEKIQSGQIEKIIIALRAYYDYILIDTSTMFNDIVFTCCEQATDIFLFTKGDISALKHAKKTITLLGSLAQHDKVKIILVDMAKYSRIKKSDVEKALGLPVWHMVPFEPKSTIEAINQGVPVILSQSSSPVSKACVSAATKYLAPPKTNKRMNRRK